MVLVLACSCMLEFALPTLTPLVQTVHVHDCARWRWLHVAICWIRRHCQHLKVIELVLISFRLLACCYLNRATGNSAMNRFTLGQTMLDNMANLQGPSRVHFGVQFGLCKPSNTAEGESVHYVFACCALDSQTWLFVFRNYLRLDVGHQMDVARIRFARF
jgi:hypothetical protein